VHLHHNSVRRQILALKPDALVLTGDSIDVDEFTHPTHPKAMADFRTTTAIPGCGV
jgi:hypothetical protein